MGFDAARAEAAVRELLLAVGEDPDRDGLRATPARVARMYAEVLSGLHAEPGDLLTTEFDERHDELIIVRGIELYSLIHGDAPSAGAPSGYTYVGFGFMMTISSGKVTRLEQWWTP